MYCVFIQKSKNTVRIQGLVFDYGRQQASRRGNIFLRKHSVLQKTEQSLDNRPSLICNTEGNFHLKVQHTGNKT